MARDKAAAATAAEIGDSADSSDDRVEMKIYVRREVRDWFEAEAVRRFRRERRRNDLVELALDEFAEKQKAVQRKNAQ